MRRAPETALALLGNTVERVLRAPLGTAPPAPLDRIVWEGGRPLYPARRVLLGASLGFPPPRATVCASPHSLAVRVLPMPPAPMAPCAPLVFTVQGVSVCLFLVRTAHTGAPSISPTRGVAALAQWESFALRGACTVTCVPRVTLGTPRGWGLPVQTAPHPVAQATLATPWETQMVGVCFGVCERRTREPFTLRALTPPTHSRTHAF